MVWCILLITQMEKTPQIESTKRSNPTEWQYDQKTARYMTS